MFHNPRTNLGPKKEEAEAPPKTKRGFKVRGRKGGREREREREREIFLLLLLSVSYTRVVVRKSLRGPRRERPSEVGALGHDAEEKTGLVSDSSCMDLPLSLPITCI